MKLLNAMPLVIMLLGLILSTGSLPAALSIGEMGIPELEERRDTIQAELESLAVFNLRTGAFGRSGYRSLQQDNPEIRGEWIQINLEEEASIDEIVLVPTLWRHSDEEGYLSDGFPEEFRILAGTIDDQVGVVVAEFDASHKLLPRVAPVVVPLKEIKASWIRIEPRKLSLRQRDRKYIFQLSEVLVFSGEKNVALHQKVTYPSQVPLNSGTWKPNLIVDGGTPYFMDSAQGAEKTAHFQGLNVNPTLTLDLEDNHQISTVHLHAAYQSKSAPPEFNVNQGIPKAFTIEGASQPDFSDASILLKHEFKDIGEFAPILMWNIPPTDCRYIRISGEPFSQRETEPSVFRGSSKIGFAEIEILAQGENVAHLKGPIRGSGPGSDHPGLAKLTDGHNIYGYILPIRTWMNQLAQRHTLEAELSLVTERLDALHVEQQSTLLLLKRLTIALIVLVALTILIGRHIRLREAAKIRERFTADLHDHLGASLHAIGILGSHTKDVLDSPEKLTKTLDQINVMTKRASEATRDFCNQQMSKEAHENLVADLRRTAGRMIANLNYTFTIEGEELLQQLKPRVRSDFFLFFKECLININRHADATEVTIRIVADKHDIHLSISDNGCGITENEQSEIPPSLARRARYLGSKVKIETPPSGGSRISLKLKSRHRYLPSFFRKSP